MGAGSPLHLIDRERKSNEIDSPPSFREELGGGFLPFPRRPRYPPLMSDLRTAALTAKAWPYEEARKLLKRYPEG